MHAPWGDPAYEYEEVRAMRRFKADLLGSVSLASMVGRVRAINWMLRWGAKPRTTYIADAAFTAAAVYWRGKDGLRSLPR